MMSFPDIKSGTFCWSGCLTSRPRRYGRFVLQFYRRFGESAPEAYLPIHLNAPAKSDKSPRVVSVVPRRPAFCASKFFMELCAVDFLPFRQWLPVSGGIFRPQSFTRQPMERTFEKKGRCVVEENYVILFFWHWKDRREVHCAPDTCTARCH